MRVPEKAHKEKEFMERFLGNAIACSDEKDRKTSFLKGYLLVAGGF
jgi:hypothetical protein